MLAQTQADLADSSSKLVEAKRLLDGARAHHHAKGKKVEELRARVDKLRDMDK